MTRSRKEEIIFEKLVLILNKFEKKIENESDKIYANYILLQSIMNKNTSQVIILFLASANNFMHDSGFGDFLQIMFLKIDFLSQMFLVIVDCQMVLMLLKLPPATTLALLLFVLLLLFSCLL